jgi:anti-anti-sigma factor
MTIADVVARQANGIFDCGGAQIRAQRRHLATVVTIRGEIDALNVDRISEYIRRFTLGESRVVLDLGDVNEFANAGVWLLYAFDADCRTAGADWSLVASPTVAKVLSDGDHDVEFAITPSVREALRDASDAIASRRRLVLPLVRKSA